MSRLWRGVGERFWALPVLCALGALGLGVGLSRLDDAFDTALTLPFLFGGGPEGARALLSAIITRALQRVRRHRRRSRRRRDVPVGISLVH